MKKHLFFLLLFLQFNQLLNAQCYSSSGGKVCNSTLTYSFRGYLSATSSWQSVTISQTGYHYFTLTDTFTSTTMRWWEVKTCSKENLQLQSGTGIIKRNLNTVNCNGSNPNDESMVVSRYDGGTNIRVLGDSCSPTTDTFTLYYRLLCYAPNTEADYGSSNWIGQVYNFSNSYSGASLSGSTTNCELMGSYGTETTNFSHNFSTGQPAVNTNCVMCPDSNIDNNKWGLVYRMNYPYGGGTNSSFYHVTCNTPNDLWVSSRGGGNKDIFNCWTDGSSYSTKTVTLLLDSTASSGSGSWVYETKKDTGNMKADITICKMDGNYTFGNGEWKAYVFDGLATPTGPGYKSYTYDNYNGTYTNNAFFYNNFGTGQPSMVGERCGVSMNNDSFYVSYKMKINLTAGKYKFRVRSEDGGYLQFQNAAGTNKGYILNPGSTGSYDLTSSYYTLSGDTFLFLRLYEYSSTSRISYIHCREPKNPGGIHASKDTICSGSTVTLTADTADGTETQWYVKSCGSSTGYVGSGASITVTIDSSTTFYVRNRSYSVAGSDTANVLDIYSPSCASKRIIMLSKDTSVHAGSLSINTGTICSGSSDTLTLTGYSGTIRWQNKTTSGWADVSGATSASYKPSNITANTDYRTIVSKNMCSLDTSNTKTVTIATAVSTPVFTAGDTVVCNGSSSCYAATAANSISVHYSIASGGASIDSLTGCVKNVTSSYTVRATARGALNCTVATADRNVTVPVVAAPTAPAAQTVCSDTAVRFVFDSILVGAGGGSIEWALSSGFVVSQILSPSASISILLQPGYTDTIWLRRKVISNGCVSSSVFTIAKVNIAPPPPTPPAMQGVISDTAYTFAFADIQAGYGGNQIEWAFNTAFGSSHFVASPAIINFKVSSESDTLLWIRSRDSISGCTGTYSGTMAIVYETEVDTFTPVYPDTFVCTGNSANVRITHSHLGLKYQLKVNTVVVETGFGNDSLLILNTHVIDTDTRFVLSAIDTATNTSNDSLIWIIVSPELGDLFFTDGDTLLHADSVSCYRAIANNAGEIIYGISSGGASIDSTGCVSSVSSNFTVRAIAKSIGGCERDTVYRKVTVTDVTEPVAPSELVVLVDTLLPLTFTFDSIYAGAGGDEIEASFYEDFHISHTSSSPATLSITLNPGSDTIIYLRSRNSSTRRVSRSVSSMASYQFPFLSAGLLDKSNWEINPNLIDGWLGNFSDEFNYPLLNGSNIWQNVKFNSKWALNGDNGADWPSTNIEHCNKHFAPGQYEFVNKYSTHTGDNGEVSIDNGIVNIQANLLNTPYEPYLDPNYGTFHCANCEQCNPAQTFYYSSGALQLRHDVSPIYWDNFDYTQPRYTEIRCKNPSGIGVHPTFWTFGAGVMELDIMENYLHDESEFTRGTSTIWDWASAPSHNGTPQGCTGYLWRKTPCNFTDDWHTYGVLITPDLDNADVRYNPEISFFIDGKETFSHKRIGSTLFPSFLQYGGAPIISLGVDPILGVPFDLPPYESQYTWQIDYVRYYLPKPNFNSGNSYTDGSNKLKYFQNTVSDVPKTLESPNASGQTPNRNNSPLSVWNNLSFPNYMVSHEVVDKKMSVVYDNTHTNYFVFYQGANNTCYEAYIQNNKWYEKPLNTQFVFANTTLTINVFDVQDFLTPVNNKLVYYQNTNNELKCIFKDANSLWQQQLLTTTGGAPLPKCGGYIFVDANNRIFYRGWGANAGKMYCYRPNLHTITTISPSVAIAGAIAVNSFGTLIFYRDDDNKLQQLYYNGGNWHLLSAPVIDLSAQSVGITDNIVIDNTNSRVFAITSDGAIYSYVWNYNTLNSNFDALRKLGYETCTNNAANDLVVSYDGNFVYYRGTDEKLWYYYNDHEVLRNNGDPYTFQPGNWNKTPVNYSRTCKGPIAVHPNTNGVVFYGGSNKRLYAPVWVNADNDLPCPWPGNPYVNDGYSYLNSYKTDEVETVHEDKPQTEQKGEMIVRVYPNPTRNNITFSLQNVAGQKDLNLKIEELYGRSVYEIHKEIPLGSNNYDLNWNTENINAGVYLYKIQLSGGNQITGKIVKL